MNLKNTLAAAVVASVGGLATMLGDAAEPAVEAQAFPAFSQNLAVNSVAPDVPAYKLNAPAQTLS